MVCRYQSQQKRRALFWQKNQHVCYIIFQTSSHGSSVIRAFRGALQRVNPLRSNLGNLPATYPGSSPVSHSENPEGCPKILTGRHSPQRIALAAPSVQWTLNSGALDPDPPPCLTSHVSQVYCRLFLFSPVDKDRYINYDDYDNVTASMS